MTDPFDWKLGSEAFASESNIGEFVENLEELLAASLNDCLKGLDDQRLSNFSRSVAAVRICEASDASLRELFKAQAMLLNFICLGSLRREIGKALGELVRRSWMARLQFPAAFSTPMLTIPKIRGVCDQSTTGLSIAARILLEARFAVNMGVPDEMLASWRNIANNAEAVE